MQDKRLEQTLRLFGELEAERGTEGMINVEARRITDNIDLFEAIIREAYQNVTMVVGGHHIMFIQEGCPLPGEIPSADALIFDCDVARAIWKDGYRDVLTKLALEPVATREALLRELFAQR